MVGLKNVTEEQGSRSLIKSAERIIGGKEMRHNKFAEMHFKSGNVLFLNTEYITSYGYLEKQDETIVAVLYESEVIHFPGDQTHEIYVSINGEEKSKCPFSHGALTRCCESNQDRKE